MVLGDTRCPGPFVPPVLWGVKGPAADGVQRTLWRHGAATAGDKCHGDAADVNLRGSRGLHAS